MRSGRWMLAWLSATIFLLTGCSVSSVSSHSIPASCRTIEPPTPSSASTPPSSSLSVTDLPTVMHLDISMQCDYALSRPMAFVSLGYGDIASTDSFTCNGSKVPYRSAALSTELSAELPVASQYLCVFSRNGQFSAFTVSTFPSPNILTVQEGGTLPRYQALLISFTSVPGTIVSGGMISYVKPIADQQASTNEEMMSDLGYLGFDTSNLPPGPAYLDFTRYRNQSLELGNGMTVNTSVSTETHLNVSFR